MASAPRVIYSKIGTTLRQTPFEDFWVIHAKGHSRACLALAMPIILMDNFPIKAIHVCVAHHDLCRVRQLEKVRATLEVSADSSLVEYGVSCGSQGRGQHKCVCCLHIIEGIRLECRALLIDHARTYGANGPCSDDASTSKKVLSCYTMRLSTVTWFRWQTVFDVRFQLMP